MPVNKNALLRYKTIDNCLRNKYRRWTLEDLVDACSDALYEMEGICKGVSVRTIQADIQMMRSDKLGFNAPIEVYEHKYYRYADDNYSITQMPISPHEWEAVQKAVDMLRQLETFDQFAEISDFVNRLQDKLFISLNHRKPIIHFDSVPQLKGLQFLSPLYNYISRKQTLRILYQSFAADTPTTFILYPYLLKEFRNRWFVFGSRLKDMTLFNFPLDRIVSIEPVADIPYRENPDFDTEHFFDNVIGVSKNIGNTPRCIKFWATKKRSKYIQTKPIHPSQRLLRENPEDGSCVFRIDVVINFEMYATFMSFGPDVRILYPRSVVSYMRDMYQQAAAMYADDAVSEDADDAEGV